jgi:hypothetical protein
MPIDPRDSSAPSDHDEDCDVLRLTRVDVEHLEWKDRRHLDRLAISSFAEAQAEAALSLLPPVATALTSCRFHSSFVHAESGSKNGLIVVMAVRRLVGLTQLS